MKLFNYTYETAELLHQFISTSFHPNDHFLIQLFCGDFDTQKITSILQSLKHTLPKSVIIGSSTAGEIEHGLMKHDSILITFCQLEKSVAKAYYFPEVSYESGKSAALTIVEKETKVCIAFAESLAEGDSEAFIDGFNAIHADVPLCGGNAADGFAFHHTFIIFEDQIFEKGIAIVSLNGDALRVHTDFSFGWSKIGKELTITRSDQDTIYEIDHKPVKEVYAHYLGDDIVQNLPNSVLEFPLVKVCDAIDVCRSVVKVNSDGSFVYKGHMHEGEKVRFSIGNVEDILHKALLLQAKINEKPAEVIFIYSCSVRKHFLKKQLNDEFSVLEQIAPTAGFFTYGEFFHSFSKNQLLNVTTTVLALSESEYIAPKIINDKTKNHSSTLKSLTHLVNETQHELDGSINFLNQYKMILDESSIVSKMNPEGIITYVNEALCTLSGYSKEELIGAKHEMLRDLNHDAVLYADLWRTIRAKKIWKGILRGIGKYGEMHYVKSTIMPILNEKDEILEYISASFDITELILKEKLIQQHFRDELTGVNNREALFHHIHIDRGNKLLILLNLVGFSEINDYLGYDVGDTLLKQIASFLIKSFENKENVVFRINGDEFAVLLGKEDLNAFKNIRDKIKKTIQNLEKKVFSIKGYEVSVRLSVGVAFGESEEIYMQSHVALKEARIHNKVITFYDTNEALKAKTRQNIQVIQKIKAAIENDRIVPFFQGIYDNTLGKITKYEVLMRLQEENGNYLSPYYFLEQAKKTRLYEKLTKIIIAKSFAYLHDKDVTFSINLTKSDILSTSVKECLFSNIQKYQCAHHVVLEIVESEGIDNFKDISSFIHEVKALGCRIAIDDFGTGYSNFVYLSKLEIDFIKIDGSLIKDIDTNPTSVMTVETIIAFAQKMGYKIVAEFVDKQSVQDKLQSLGVDFSQGYLFSKPSPTL